MPNSLVFLAEAVRDFRTTGAVAPSGRQLAVALAGPLREATRAGSVLEVGAGTGAVTRELIPLLGPGSRLDVVEANARLAERLRRRVADETGEAGEAGAAGRVRVHPLPIEEFERSPRSPRVPRDGAYDVIVSSLPFTNFAPERVEAIMGRYLRLLRPGGALTFFSYAGTRALRTLLSSPAEVARHRAVERVLAGYQARYGARARMVWANVPPARVWRLRAAGQ
jgi:phospholipid N-methyltransferase